MSEPIIRDLLYVNFREASLQEPWSQVKKLLKEVPGLLVIATDSGGDPVGVLDERTVSRISSTEGLIGDYLDEMISTELVGSNLSVGKVFSAMATDPEARWFTAKEGDQIIGIAAPEAILSAYLRWNNYTGAGVGVLGAIGTLTIANVFGIPLTDPQWPRYCCQSTPQHCYRTPVPRDRFKRPICPVDKTMLHLTQP